MIIVNEKKLIKDPNQMEVLNHFKQRSNNEYYVKSVENFIFYDGLLIRYCFKIDNILYYETFCGLHGFYHYEEHDYFE